ncbi:hypothetical protein PL9214520348 [Planktothrix tepida PCC 9214]|uniref:Uncharacterized protein n=1 Tax=Planktothrix tepida PCC 9214 TaxID=671072 RepID=A0A1J1LQG3_9CYAN|nr:hypothetical protein PL9214520348 [Planktothrix tepida PCC 9214]
MTRSKINLSPMINTKNQDITWCVKKWLKSLNNQGLIQSIPNELIKVYVSSVKG